MEEIKVTGEICHSEDDYGNTWAEIEDDESRDYLSDIVYKKIPKGTKVEVIVKIVSE